MENQSTEELQKEVKRDGAFEEDKITNKEYKELKQFARILRLRILKDYDAVVAITGEEGVGKSACAIAIGRETDPRFSIERNELVVASPTELERKIKEMRKGSCIIADEAIKILYKQQWATKSQRWINQLYTLARKENKITCLCIPRFRDLNEYFRNHRVKFWIYVLGRGVAVVFIRDWSPFAKDPWWMDENQKILDTWFKGKRVQDIDIENKIKVLRKSRNFLMVFTFPDFNEEEKIIYKNLVASTRYEMASEEETRGAREKKYRNCIRNAVIELLKEGKSLRKIAEMFSYSTDTIKNIVGEEYKSFTQPKKQKKSFLKQLK